MEERRLAVDRGDNRSVRGVGPDADGWTNTVLDAGDDAAMAQQAEIALSARLPSCDVQTELADRIVRQVMSDRSIIKVEQMSEHTGLSIRQLQRLFSKYIGVNPKWVIKRFRLQEAAERLEKDESAQWTELAMQLGYFDQAHFIKDFKSVLGQSPAAYRKSTDNQRRQAFKNQVATGFDQQNISAE